MVFVMCPKLPIFRTAALCPDETARKKGTVRDMLHIKFSPTATHIHTHITIYDFHTHTQNNTFHICTYNKGTFLIIPAILTALISRAIYAEDVRSAKRYAASYTIRYGHQTTHTHTYSQWNIISILCFPKCYAMC